MLVDYFLQARRSGFDSEEDSIASGSRHERNQIVVDAVGAGAAVPREVGLRLDHGVAKRRDPAAIDGEHIVDQIEVLSAIAVIHEAHLLEDPLRRFQPEIAPEEIIRRTELAGERAA